MKGGLNKFKNYCKILEEPITPINTTSTNQNAASCEENQFSCNTSMPMCLLDHQVCDGNSDCPSGEDEIFCGEFKQM